MPPTMIPIAPPANYSESQYELVRRYIACPRGGERRRPSERRD